MTSASTATVELVTTPRTHDLPEFTRTVSAPRTEADETIEDGLAMQAEIGLYRGQASDTFTELDDFFRTLE